MSLVYISPDGDLWREGDIFLDGSGRELKLMRQQISSVHAYWFFERFEGVGAGGLAIDQATAPLVKVHLVKVGEEAAFCERFAAGELA